MPQDDIFINFWIDGSLLLSARNMLLLEGFQNLFVFQSLYNLQYKVISENHNDLFQEINLLKVGYRTTNK